MQRDDQESAATPDALPGHSFRPDSQNVIVPYGGKIHRLQAATGEDRTVLRFVLTDQVEVDKAKHNGGQGPRTSGELKPLG